MKKLTLLIVFLSMSAPLFATISPEEFAEKVESFRVRKEVEAIAQGEDPGTATERTTNYVNSLLRDANKNYALHAFALEGKLPLVEYLVEVKGANPNSKEGSYTVLDRAKLSGNQELVQYLIDNGAIPQTKAVKLP